MSSLPGAVARRTVVAVFLVLFAAGSAFAAAGAVHPAALAEAAKPAETAEPSEAPDPTEAADATRAPEATRAPRAADAPDASKATQAGSNAAPASIPMFVARLKAAGITITEADLAALAAKVGVGGAVRAVLFAQESGKPVADIVAMFQGGKGWGLIARELQLTHGPGIGRVVGQGHGNGHANGKGNAHP